jgi:NTP pyrophosphatase (non-canonical NTP hydrolase)
MKIQEEAIQLVFDERQRQDEMRGEQNHKPLLWTAILSEEVGEFAKASLHQEFGGPDADNVLAEAVQCAAVGLAIVECLLRNKTAQAQAARPTTNIDKSDEHEHHSRT